MSNDVKTEVKTIAMELPQTKQDLAVEAIHLDEIQSDHEVVSSCCTPKAQSQCCEPSEKDSCCGNTDDSCGCQ